MCHRCTVFRILEQYAMLVRGGLCLKNREIFSFSNAFLVFPADYKIGAFQRPA